MIIQCKLIDFSVAKDVSNLNNNKITEYCGSALYSAPEVLKRNYSTQCDIWSIGMIMYEILVGQNPFE